MLLLVLHTLFVDACCICYKDEIFLTTCGYNQNGKTRKDNILLCHLIYQRADIDTLCSETLFGCKGEFHKKCQEGGATQKIVALCL